MIFLKADCNAQNASGNPPLHVCAVNNQVLFCTVCTSCVLLVCVLCTLFVFFCVIDCITVCIVCLCTLYYW